MPLIKEKRERLGGMTEQDQKLADWSGCLACFCGFIRSFRLSRAHHPEQPESVVHAQEGGRMQEQRAELLTTSSPGISGPTGRRVLEIQKRPWLEGFRSKSWEARSGPQLEERSKSKVKTKLAYSTAASGSFLFQAGSLGLCRAGVSPAHRSGQPRRSAGTAASG